VHGVTQLGVRLRVLADRSMRDAASQLRSVLEQRGIHAKIENTHASLEDVFVVATRNDRNGRE
jgi:ABC-2 type transport system ATP-binding protein